jgi:hypothetical protein
MLIHCVKNDPDIFIKGNKNIINFVRVIYLIFFFKLSKMENIIEPTFDFDFSKLYLGSPISTSSGTYFTKILYGNKSLYVQTPKSLTKQGFIKSGKKIYTDLMFTNFDNLFVDWIERLQNKCEDLLYERSQSWFETKLEKDDIETAFTSPIKVFKSGKNYLIRVNVKQGIKIYDENNNLVDLDMVTNEQNIISILEIQGIKFTSKNFQIEIELKQCMTVSPDPFLEKCFIKNHNKNTTDSKLDKFDHDEFEKEKQKEENIFLEENMFDKKVLHKKDTIDMKVDDLVNTSITDLFNNGKLGDMKEMENNLENNLEKEKVNKNVIKDKYKGENEYPNDENNIKEKNIKNNEENIFLEIEEIDIGIGNSNNNMTEVDISLEDKFDVNVEEDSIKLKNREQVYKEIYQKAKDKVKELKNATIVAYMELKNIKSMYMVDDIYESDDDIEELNMIDLELEK